MCSRWNAEDLDWRVQAGWTPQTAQRDMLRDSGADCSDRSRGPGRASLGDDSRPRASGTECGVVTAHEENVLGLTVVMAEWADRENRWPGQSKSSAG